MKKLVLLLVIAANTSLFPQEFESGKAFSAFRSGAFAGINFSGMLGSSFLIEERTNLADNVNLKLSLGYSNIYREENIFIIVQPLNRPENYAHTTGADAKIRYAVFPISAGMEYYFSRDGTYPFIFAETGVNIYSSSLSSINGLHGENYTSLYNEKNWSADFRAVFGLGISFKASSTMDIETRYAYQINSSIENVSQILVGVIF